MSIIIRLQNLPWAADSVDIRRYFSGLSIPEGGVHIVGGEMGDAFIAFSTDEDARLAMAKDGGKIHEMQIKLLLSSRTEMMRVIEKARQLNLAMQAQALPVVTQPAVLPAAPQPLARVPPPPPPVEEDRRRVRSPSPHRRGSRDKSPGRGDRRRSPDSRRSKRDRSRSPTRSSRGGNRDTDRRDRSKRDDRRHDDGRGRDDRHSGRESSHESKKYPETDSFGRQPRSNPPADGYRESNNNRYNDAPSSNVSSYTYDTAPTTEGMKGLPAAFYPQSVNPIHTSDPFAVGKQMAATVVSSSSTSVYMQQPTAYGTVPYGQPVPGTKESPVTAQSEHMNRRSRFEPGYSQSQDSPYFGSPNLNTKASMPEVPYNDKRPTPQDFHPPNRNAWSSPSDVQGNNWAQKRPGILEPPTKNGDFAQVVPMDIEQSPPPEMPPDKSIFNSEQYLAHRNMPPMRGTGMHHDKQWQASPSLSIVITGLPPDARIEEVQEIFRNISISPLNICIEANAQGAEKAFIRFSKISDFQEAVNGPPRYIRNYRCEIIPCPDAVFEAAAAAPKAIKPRPKPIQKDSDLCVQLRGLPYSSKESEIQRFFEGLNIVDIAVELSSEGRSVGIAFVEFATEKDFRMALTMNGKMIGHRFITISIASKDHIVVARGLDYAQNVQPKVPLLSANDFDNRHPQHPPGPPIEPASGPAPPVLPRPTNFCISIKGMPNSVTNQDIVLFLGELSATIRAIHLMLGPDKRPSGEAFVEFGTKEEATAALNKNNMVLLGSRIFLSPISFDEMTEILKGPKAMPPPPGPGPLLKTPLVASPDKPRRPLIEVPPLQKDFIEPHHNHMKNERPHFDHSANDQQHFGHPREQFPPHERSRPDYPRGDRPPLDFPHGERPPSEFPRGDRPPSEFPRGERPPSEFPRGGRPPSEFPRGGRPPSEFRHGEMPPSEFPRNDRPPSDFPRGEKPPRDFPRNVRPPSDFPRNDRPPSDFPRNDRPPSDFPRNGRPPSDFPRNDRPPSEFPRGEKPPRDFPRNDRPPSDFPRGDKPPRDFHRGERPSREFPRSERPNSDFPYGERPHPNFPHGERPHQDFPPVEPSHSDFPPDEFPHSEGPPPEFQGERPPPDYQRGERPHPNFPRSNFPRGDRPRMDYPRGERPRLEPRFRGGRPPHMERGMRPPFGRMRGPFPSRPGGPPPQDHSSPAGFGAPGCVVSINNLHYDAGLEELYEFFKDYMLTKDNIIRRFDESGRATAEARVSFQCPADAQRAVRELNKKTIMGRSLFLSLL